MHEPGSRVKKPRTASSQQPACDHEEHQILSASEAAAFAAQFWDKKTHPTKASQHEYVPNNKHGDVCPNGVLALPEKDNANDDSE